MRIIYNGILLDVIGNASLEYDVVMDDSQTDVLYTRASVACTAYVNGAAEVRTNAGPPLSVIDTGTTAFRNVEAVNNRPPGVPAPGVISPTPPFVGPHPPNTDGATRQLGAARDFGAETVAPGPRNFPPNRPAPGFASELRQVEVLTPGPNAPALSHVLVRKRLTDPRGKLFIFNGVGGPGDLLLQSPAFNRHCDCKNGPIPSYFNIVQVHGDSEGTLIVQWACSTFVHEQSRTSPTDPLLSNRFSMAHIVDEDSFMRIAVQGEARFDVGLLHALGQNPDQFRPNLMLPCPLGFVREGLTVEGIPDMSGVRYNFTDRQQHVSFPAGPFVGATRIVANHQQQIVCDADVLEGAINSMDRAINRFWMLGSMGGHGRNRAPRGP